MKFHVGYVPDTRKGNDKFKIKGTFGTKSEANKFKKELEKKSFGFLPYYEIWTDKSVRAQWEECDVETQNRRARGVEKRKKEYAKKSPESRKKTFILCPHCKATSKKLYSEMGGLQTRVCKNGHRFEYDKWIGDRLGSIMIFGNPVKAIEFMSKNPVKMR